ncbi:helix-turn-helix domain-containing protein [Nocardia gipuzkoensis]|uniref:helix-turn-helix domain-containing protein n=1 Tax=Nocardia gipuzkoensis TaxID=2749991 RepID=UPI0015EF0C65|nr:helix-turn-helix transcriptional regulator [Nocardia gipuzkoensis]
MNVHEASAVVIAPAVWESPVMRAALARRDLKRVFELLQRGGFSQREIGRQAGLSSSEVYQVLHRNRRISAYDVLAKIADGLKIPRGYMGLAYDDSTENNLDLAAATCSTIGSERDEVRSLLSHAANVTMGTAAEDIAHWWQPLEREIAPAPTRIGRSDVDRIRALTAAMRAIDYRHGGGACRDAIAAQVRWSQQLLNADGGDQVKEQLKCALADLHNLAGWTSFDVGLYSPARKHFGRALELARSANDFSLSANILYRTGRLHLHRGMPNEALRFFQLGQIAAQDSGCALTVAMLCVNEAWTYGQLGDREQMRRSVGRAQDEFSRAERENAPVWVRFFGDADLNASIGVALVSTVKVTKRDLADGIEFLQAALARRSPDMNRSKAFELTALASAHLDAGAREDGLRVGRSAVATASTVRSVRAVDRLAPLRKAATKYPNDAGLKDLARSINSLEAVK